MSKPASRPSTSSGPKPAARTSSGSSKVIKNENVDIDSDVEDTDYEDSDWNRRLLQVQHLKYIFGAVKFSAPGDSGQCYSNNLLLVKLHHRRFKWRPQ